MTEVVSSYHPLSGSYTVKGEILKKWNKLGAEEGILGYPIAPAISYKNDAYSMAFQKGSIYYHPEFGAHFICGKFYLYWADNLGIFGKYGYPVSDPYNIKILNSDSVEITVVQQNFERGKINSNQHEIRNRADLRGEIARRGICIREQGPRPTCSVQVMVFLLEYMYTTFLGRAYNHLSVEYANHFANVATGGDDDGDYFSSIAAGYDEFGCIDERVWRYDKDWKYDYEKAKQIADASMIELGRKMLETGIRLKGGFIKEIGPAGLSSEQFDQLIAFLDDGIPVSVGRDHSLAAVGYEKDKNQPGGGVIYFRNSYGTSPYFTGYQVETFENVKNTVFDMYVYTGIE